MCTLANGEILKLLPLHGTPLYYVNTVAESQESRVKRSLLLRALLRSAFFAKANEIFKKN